MITDIVGHYNMMMNDRLKYQRITKRFIRTGSFSQHFARHEELIDEVIERGVPAKWLEFIDNALKSEN